jgi:hypothetical protein
MCGALSRRIETPPHPHPHPSPAARELRAQLAQSPGPALNNTTTPAFVRFHDDKRTYTGMYAANMVGKLSLAERRAAAPTRKAFI